MDGGRLRQTIYLIGGGAIMITGDSGRMLEFLWFVGYCEEFPSQLALRVGGHPEWNRHVKYKAIKKGYVEVFRGT